MGKRVSHASSVCVCENECGRGGLDGQARFGHAFHLFMPLCISHMDIYQVSQRVCNSCWRALYFTQFPIFFCVPPPSSSFKKIVLSSPVELTPFSSMIHKMLRLIMEPQYTPWTKRPICNFGCSHWNKILKLSDLTQTSLFSSVRGSHSGLMLQLIQVFFFFFYN